MTDTTQDNNSNAGSSPLTLRDQALGAIPADLHAKVLARATDIGVTSDQDATWLILSHVMTAVDAATAANDAVAAMKKEISAIQEAIYRGTSAAGADLRSQVGAAGKEVMDAVTGRVTAIQKGLELAVQEGINAGAARLEGAITTLNHAAMQRRDAIVKDWEIAAGKAVAAAAQKGLAARLARSWSVVVASLLLTGMIGAAGTLMTARLTDHLTPWDVRLATNVSGRPECGTLRSRDGKDYAVCLTQ